MGRSQRAAGSSRHSSFQALLRDLQEAFGAGGELPEQRGDAAGGDAAASNGVQRGPEERGPLKKGEP